MSSNNELHISESFLVADIGHSTTTVALFDIVEGSYRFVARACAPTTLGSPWRDAAVGVRQAIATLTQQTQRPLLDRQRWLITPAKDDHVGVDHFTATVSATEPLKTVIVGLLDEVSVQSARRALATIYAQEVDCLSLADTRTEAEQIEAIVQKQPELILIVGGTDGGDTTQVLKQVETIATTLELMAQTQHGGQRPELIYAGNRQLREPVVALLGGLTNLHVVDNVRPTLEQEHLYPTQQQLSVLYDDLKVSALPGMGDIAGWCRYPFMPTAQAFAGISQYIAALSRGHVLGLDVGSDQITVVSAQPNQTQLAIRTDLGMGAPLQKLPDVVAMADLHSWLPHHDDNEALFADFILHKSLFPHTVPFTETELRMEQAVLREMMRHAMLSAAASWGWSAQQWFSPNLFLLRGNVFAGTIRPGQVVLMALDAIQPVGIFALAIDKYGVLPALGALAPHKPLVTVQSLEGGVLVDLGWVVALAGRGQPGQKALEIHLDAGSNGVLDAEVAFGELEILPLAPGQTAQLTVKPLSRQFDVGFGPGQGQKITIHGGLVGVVIDARGRPLTKPRDPEARINLLQEWVWKMGG